MRASGPRRTSKTQQRVVRLSHPKTVSVQYQKARRSFYERSDYSWKVLGLVHLPPDRVCLVKDMCPNERPPRFRLFFPAPPRSFWSYVKLSSASMCNPQEGLIYNILSRFLLEIKACPRIPALHRFRSPPVTSSPTLAVQYLRLLYEPPDPTSPTVRSIPQDPAHLRPAGIP